MTEGEHEAGVATEKPSVAIDQQPGAGSSSSVVQSFFRIELPAIKEKQVQQD